MTFAFCLAILLPVKRMIPRPPDDPDSLTALLRSCLADAPSIRAVARETGNEHMALIRFMRGDSHLRLDKADALAKYFGIHCRLTRKTKGKD